MLSRARVKLVSIGLVCVFLAGSLFADLHVWWATVQLHQDQQRQPVVLSTVADHAKVALQYWPHAYLTRWTLMAVGYRPAITAIDDLAAQFAPVVEHQQFLPAITELSQGDHRILVLFQNSDELRATGGFIGSFATIALHGGQLAPLTVTDIYAPAGQLTDFVPPPPGVREYLSSGKGWGLPDANWSPDFPTSAKTVLQFLNKAKYPSYETVIAVNTDVLANILKVTGPIELPDQKQTITEQNYAQVLRADRQEFFAGSYQKVNVLRQLSSRLLAKLELLPAQQKMVLVANLVDQIKKQNILIYSTNSNQQQLVEALGAAGKFQSSSANTLLIAPVESNVGINKVNPFVSRQIHLYVSQARKATLSITYQNHHPQQSYINYLRLYFGQQTQLNNLKLNNQLVVSTPSAELDMQVMGFLVPVAANQVATVSAELSPTPGSQWQLLEGRTQPGLKNVDWQVQLPHEVVSAPLQPIFRFPLNR